MRYEEVVQDYFKLIEEFGQVYDYTGVIQSELPEVVLFLKPTKTTAKNIMIGIIKYGFQDNNNWNSEQGKTLISSSKFLTAMYNKYC